MKILFDLRVLSSDWSGIASYTKNLVMALSSGIGKNQVAALVSGTQSKQELSDLIGSDISFLFSEIIPFSYGIYDIKGFLPLRKLLSQGKFDLYFTPQYFWPYYFNGSTQVAAIIHDIIPLTHSALLKKSRKVKLKFLFSICTWLTVKCSKILFVNSASTRNEIVRFYGERYSEKIRVLYPSFARKGERKTNKDNPAKDNYLIYVGRQDPYKNLIKLVEAFRLICDRGFKGELLLVGKVDQRYQELETRIQNLNLGNRIKFTGFVSDEDLKMMYRKARLSIQPSLAEGFGLTAFEPFLNDCLTVVSDIPVMRETLGNDGLYFNPESAEDMAMAIEEALTLDKTVYMEIIDKIKVLLKEYCPEKQAAFFRNTINEFLSPETD